LFLVSVAVVSAIDKCPTPNAGGVYGTGGWFANNSINTGGSCTNNAVGSFDPTLGCSPSSDCGYLYCCLPCSVTGGGSKNVCLLPPQVSQLTIVCAPNAGTGQNWFGCPCTNQNECLNNGDGWQCSVPPANASNIYYKNSAGTIVQRAYPETVCWTQTLPNYGVWPATFSNGQPPKLPICAIPADCKATSNLANLGLSPNTPNVGWPCDQYTTHSGCTTTQASCDPVTHSCQSRQIVATNTTFYGPWPNGTTWTSYVVNTNWFYNTNCQTC